jgi:hypothetical protein
LKKNVKQVSLRRFRAVYNSCRVNFLRQPWRTPRLVVDSTVSDVIQDISIPNRMLLPRITDVLQAAPEMASSMELEAFTLDISKAH